MGPRALLVEQATQGTASCHLQRPRRYRDYEAVFPRAVQEETLPHACFGYYEWQDTAEGKQPWYFTARDGSPVLTIASLWDEWKNCETGERLKSCAMIITEPNDFVAEVHDRMPVLLKHEQFEHWLSGDMGVDDLNPVENGICKDGRSPSGSTVQRLTATIRL